MEYRKIDNKIYALNEIPDKDAKVLEFTNRITILENEVIKINNHIEELKNLKNSLSSL